MMLKTASFFRVEKDPFYKQGEEKGKSDVVENLIVKLGFTDEQAADVAEVSVNFVKKVRAELDKKKK